MVVSESSIGPRILRALSRRVERQRLREAREGVTVNAPPFVLGIWWLLYCCDAAELLVAHFRLHLVAADQGADPGPQFKHDRLVSPVMSSLPAE